MCSTSLWVRLAHCSGVLLWKSGCAPPVPDFSQNTYIGPGPCQHPCWEGYSEKFGQQGCQRGCWQGCWHNDTPR